MEKKELGKTSIGMEANVAALLAYSVGWVTGLIFFLIEKENKFVRFHALQSIIMFGVLSLAGILLSVFFSFFMMIRLTFVFPLFILVGKLLWLAGVVLWILMMIKGYQGEKFKLPVIGDIAEKNA